MTTPEEKRKLNQLGNDMGHAFAALSQIQSTQRVHSAHHMDHKAGLSKIEAKLDQYDRRFDQVEAKLDQYDRRFDQVEAKLDQHDRRFDQVEAKLDQHDRRFDQVEAKLDQIIGLLGD